MLISNATITRVDCSIKADIAGHVMRHFLSGLCVTPSFSQSSTAAVTEERLASVLLPDESAYVQSTRMCVCIDDVHTVRGAKSVVGFRCCFWLTEYPGHATACECMALQAAHI